jgi:hypothetical protein
LFINTYQTANNRIDEFYYIGQFFFVNAHLNPFFALGRVVSVTRVCICDYVACDCLRRHTVEILRPEHSLALLQSIPEHAFFLQFLSKVDLRGEYHEFDRH